MDAHELTFGPFRLDGSKGTLLRDGELLSVGQRGIRLLEALLRRPGEVLTKAELLDAAWPGMAIEESNLSVQIAQLRKALGRKPDGGEWVETIPRVGYRIVPAKNWANKGATADAAPVTPPQAIAQSRRLRWAAALLAVALVAAVTALVFPWSARVAAPVTASADLSIAVLPFDDLTGNSELAYFGAGVAEDIVSMLARVPELTVAARNSSFRYRGPVDIRQVGEELGVTYVLEGSVRKDADRVRIVAQLIHARTGKHVWAERFDRTGTDPLALQDEVTEKIAATLAGYSGAIRRAAYRDAWGRDSATLREYDYFLRAQDVGSNFTAAANEGAMVIWREGIGRFPESSLLKMLGALLHIKRHLNAWSHDHEADIREAGRLAREALAQPNPAPLTRKGAHYVLAFVNLRERDYDQALVEAETSIALASHDGPFITGLSEVPIAIGQPSLALEWIERGARGFAGDDPWQILVTAYRGWATLVGGQPEQALVLLDDPKLMWLPWKIGIPLLRAMAYTELGHLEDARAEIAKALEIDPTYSRAKFRNRNIHFDPTLLDDAIKRLAAAGLPEN